MHRGFVFECTVQLGAVLDTGKQRPTWLDFHGEYGHLDFQTLSKRGFDSVKLETGSGEERVVYHSGQVRLDRVRACSGRDELEWTSDWVSIDDQLIGNGRVSTKAVAFGERRPGEGGAGAASERGKATWRWCYGRRVRWCAEASATTVSAE